MTTPRIKEMAKDWLFAGDEPKKEDEAVYKEFIVFLTQAHQSWTDEVVEFMRKKVEHNIQYLRKPVNGEDRFQMKRRRANNNYINGQNQALDDTIKALQDNK